MLGSILGGLGSIAGGLFGSDQDWDAGAQVWEGAEDKFKPYYDPYITAGKEAIPQFQKQLQMLLSDPSQIMKLLGNSYTQSPGYAFNMQQGMDAANQAAAAGGMLGTLGHQKEAQRVASGLASSDFNNYMQNALGLYGTGLSGTQGLMSQGLNSSDLLSQKIMNILQNRAGAMGAAQYNQNQSNSAGLGSIFGGLQGISEGGGLRNLPGAIGGIFG